jgi:hypothetical protein
MILSQGMLKYQGEVVQNLEKYLGGFFPLGMAMGKDEGAEAET